MNVNLVITREYKNISNWTLGENEPKTNPIKANLKPIKANKMPKQTQYKPNQTQLKPISKVGYTFLDYAVAIIAGLCYALCRYDLAFRKAVYLNYETYTI